MLTYAAICTVVFKLFRIPINKWSIPTAVLGGIVLIGTLVVVMNYNHPYAESTRLYFRSVPIIPQVRGRVTEVPVVANTPVTKGDVLFRIDDAPYRDKVAALEARLQGAKEDREHMRIELDRSRKLQAKGAASDREAERWQTKLEGAEAAVKDAEAQLRQVQFDLDNTVVRAPTDGMVTQLTLRPGMMAGRTNMAAVMTFIPREDAALIGWFRQNSLLRLQAGDEAEVTFDAIPGQVFGGHVKLITPVIAEGQLNPTSDLIEFVEHDNPGRVAVMIELDEPPYRAYDLPHGLFGQSAIYTEHAHHLALLRKILLRMASWLDYLFPFH